MTDATDPLALATALTRRTRLLCEGLEQGRAELYDWVTPTTAELLRWWFGEDACQARAVNFHQGQRQAILNMIVAHEVMDSPDLADLYRQACPQVLLDDARLAEAVLAARGHPKYCLKMATGTGKTWVLQALLVWQLLNKSATQEDGLDDPRFTRRFLLVAPGLIVYERLLDALLGKRREDGGRDYASADLARHQDLFAPPAYRERIAQFVRGNVCDKGEIGLKTTGNGLIAVTNWHLLSEAGEAMAREEADCADAPRGADAAPRDLGDAAAIAYDLLPLSPGRAAGNDLDALDRRWARGNVLAYLAGLPDLMVFNDEAHHIHQVAAGGEASEVEWHKSLSVIATGKGRRFTRVDFSATPYNDVGRGKRRAKAYFPHIVADFDLKAAMRLGLVKSLVLDRRRELGALPLKFKAERDDADRPTLSDGQRVMLRAGLHKLRRLETEFARLDPARHPKMLVVCEDTKVTPRVAAFLRDDEGLDPEDVLTVDSGKKAELGEKEWAPLRRRLFDLDRHARPRVIVSVLMLREGFDVDNICVIVPLRSSQAPILLEQTVGRGLRLMWREPEYADIKRENRERIDRGEEPGALLDILSIVEHPAFQGFYDDLAREGLLGASGDGDDHAGAGIGDLVAAELRQDYTRYDIAIPFILREADERLEHRPIDVHALAPFGAMDRARLAGLLGRGDAFASQDLQSHTLFGDYRVDGAAMNVGGYNELLARLTRRIGQALSQPLPRGGARAQPPYLQLPTAALAGALDDYIRERLFDEPFEPFADEGWRLLLLQPVVEHVVRVFGLALRRAEERRQVGEADVRHRRLSEVPRLTVRASASLDAAKCIYTRLPYPVRSGGLERSFIAWASADASVEAFCRISEHRHDFMRLRYVKEDGLAASYIPDFLVRTATAVYLVETKAQQQLIHANVQRKLKAAVAWCERINALPPERRGDRPWHYVLLGESTCHAWRRQGARLAELLEFARTPALVGAAQAGLALD